MLDLFVYNVKIEGNDLAALSFVPPDVVAEHGLPAEAVLGEVDPRQPDMTVDGFQANEAFLTYLHNLISERAADLQSMQDQAERVGNGPAYVMDYRTINAGAKPPYEDVLGWFGVSNGEIVRDSYNANPNYKLLTNAGPLTLEDALETALITQTKQLIDADW